MRHSKVDLWIVNLDSLLPKYYEYLQLLSSHEKERENRFVFEYLKKRFTIAHGVLRTLLMQYLNVKNQSIEFSFGMHGKPFLANLNNDLHFNLSHSHHIAAFGFSYEIEIGIDIECLEKTVIEEGLENYVFSNGEKQIFSNLDSEEKIQAFLNTWTRKEAISKAMGIGIASGLNTIEIEIDPKKPPRIISIFGNDQASSQWSLHTFNGNEFVGAIAAKSSIINLQTHNFHTI